MPRSHKDVEILLQKLEQSLRQAKLWSRVTPPLEALNSPYPFSVDTLSFQQWLQFIFIPKMLVIVNNESKLPDSMSLLPMAEQSLGKTIVYGETLDVIRQIDEAFLES